MIKDVRKYFISMQKQMNDANKALEQINKEIEAGKVTEDQKNNFKVWYDTIYVNYNRLLYIMHLLQMPPKFIQKIRQKKLDKQTFEFVEKISTQEAVEQENKECLDEMKAMIDEKQEDKEE